MDTDVETAAAVASNSYVTLGDIQQLLDNFESGDASPPLDRGHLDANGHYPDEAGYDPDAEYDPNLEVGDSNWREDCWNLDLHLHQHGAQRLHPEQLVFNEEPSTGEPAAEEPTQPTYYRAGDEYERLLAEEEAAANGGRAR
jgi:hypothetical protein